MIDDMERTTTAAIITSRIQVWASGDIILVVEWCSNSWRLVKVIDISRKSRMSPAQSSGKSAKDSVMATAWPTIASLAHATTAARAGAGAHNMDGSRWYARNGSSGATSISSGGAPLAQCSYTKWSRARGLSRTTAKTALWCTSNARQASSDATSRGLSPSALGPSANAPAAINDSAVAASWSLIASWSVVVPPCCSPDIVVTIYRYEM